MESLKMMNTETGNQTEIKIKLEIKSETLM